MAEITGDSYNTSQQAGEYGNACTAIFTKTLAAGQIGDIVKYGVIPGSAKITCVTLINAALGASSTQSLGVRYVKASEGSTAATQFFTTQATSSAGRNESAAGVYTVATGRGVEIIGTLAGAAATGLVTVLVDYVYVGQ